jgi:NTP pyrophosphatase (non-canonical NTP hydrolase)
MFEQAIKELALDTQVYAEVWGERQRQNAKWGSDSIVHRTSEAGFRVLGEETGEVAKAINERDRAQARKELVQVAAVAVAMIEALDAGADLVAPKNEPTKGESHGR